MATFPYYFQFVVVSGEGCPVSGWSRGERVEGRPRLSWGGTRTAVSRIQLNRKMDAGRWFKLTATRNNQVGTLSVEDCTESGEFCKECKADDPTCFKKATGEAG